MSYELIDVNEIEYMEKYHVSSLLGKILASSSLTEQQIDEILNGDMELSYSYAPCIEECIKRILLAQKNHEKVFIGGDYDADGITATAIMKDTLDRLGIQNGYYIPDRFKEGYGLSSKTVQAAYDKGYTLIMTVDNGVKAHEAIAKAHELGIDIIVTDHHTIEEEVNATLLVHPTLMEEQFCYLSGAGVALEISRRLLGDIPLHTTLACIASIGDVMQLWKETRKIVKCGLRYLEQNAIPSINALFRNGSEITPTSISFQVVPKLNSVGRMNDLSNVNTLVTYLLLKDINTIHSYVQQLNHVNDVRKNLSNTMCKEAEKQLTDDDLFIIYDESFHEGICGLAAGKIANQYHKPTLIFAKNGEQIKGSGRSVEGFDLFTFLSQDFEMLTAFGGHTQAVGLAMNEEDFESFKQVALDKMKESQFVYEPPVTKAIQIQSDQVSIQDIMDLNRLLPIPKEIETTLFAIVEPVLQNKFESSKVIKYHFANQNTGFDAILFPWKGLDKVDEPRLVIGQLSLNRWRNQITPQMEIEYIEA